MYGPDGDKARMLDPEDTSAVESKSKKTPVDELPSYNGRGDTAINSDLSESVSEGTAHPPKKKKKKSKHHEEKDKRKSKTADKEREEWPSLVPNSSSESLNANKRKSSTEPDLQKERPVVRVLILCFKSSTLFKKSNQ